MVISQGSDKIYCRLSANIVPHSGVGGCAPIPRNPNAAASKIADEKLMVAWTISGARQFGSTFMNINLSVEAPMVLLEET